MVAIAAAMFVALFGWGQDYFGWEDSSGKVQLALFTSFADWFRLNKATTRFINTYSHDFSLQ